MQKIFLFYVDDEKVSSPEAASVYYSDLVSAESRREAAIKLLKHRGNAAPSNKDIEELFERETCFKQEVIE